jgi:mannosyltransferase OCH1-like enzyme
MEKNNVNDNSDLILGTILTSNFFKHQRIQDDFHIKWTDEKYWRWLIDEYDLFLNSSDQREIIPRTIHQIWLGSNVPKKYDQWRKSWKLLNPGFEYILWDENKILKTGLINEKQFIKSKSFGVKSDIARYEILYKFGGIYVDTDFEALKPIDRKFLSRSFIAGQLYDYKPQINNALIMSEPKCNLLKEVIENIPDYTKEMTGVEVLNYSGANYLSKIIFKNRNLADIVILPSQYFYPWPNFMSETKNSPYSWETETTIAIHHWEASWMKKSFLLRLYNKIKKILFKR